MVSVRIQIVSRVLPHYGDTVSAQRLSIVVQGLVSVAHGRSCVARVGTGLAKVYSSDTCFPLQTVIADAPFLVPPAVAQATERKRMVLQPQSAENRDGYLIGTSCEK